MSDDIIQCPFCGEDIGANDVRCKHCDELLKDEAVQINYEETKKCPFCGEEILAVAKKCKHCGEFFENMSSELHKTSVSGQLTIKEELPPEHKRFNWGAFFGTWIWGLGNESYIALLAIPVGIIGLIPIVGWLINLAFCVFLGIKGNEWAWNNKNWKSIEDFHHVQRVWATVFVVLWCVFVLPFIIIFTVNFMIGFAEGFAEGLSETL